MPARKSALKPAALPAGTRVEVRDLFYATPAQAQIHEIGARRERGHQPIWSSGSRSRKPEIAFSLGSDETHRRLRLEACPAGLLDHAPRADGAHSRPRFAADALPLRAARGKIALEGFAGLPTLHRPNALQLHLVVNGRPVRDKLLVGTVRAAYGDLLPQGPLSGARAVPRPAADEVDVNVHPAKTELQIPRSERGARRSSSRALKEALGTAGHRATVVARASRARPRCVRASGRRQARCIRRRRSEPAAFGFPNKPRRRSLRLPSRAATRAARRHRGCGARARLIRSAPRARRSTTPSSSPRPRMRSSSLTSTPRMSASSMSG